MVTFYTLPDHDRHGHHPNGKGNLANTSPFQIDLRCHITERNRLRLGMRGKKFPISEMVLLAGWDRGSVREYAGRGKTDFLREKETVLSPHDVKLCESPPSPLELAPQKRFSCHP